MTTKETDEFDHFISAIMSIEASASNVFGGGLPGNVGVSVSQEGALNSGMDVTWQLKQAVMRLANAYKANAPKAVMIEHAKIVEGCLLSEQLLSILNQKQVDILINELQTIVKPA
jgi:hypothetical protein